MGKHSMLKGSFVRLSLPPVCNSPLYIQLIPKLDYPFVWFQVLYYCIFLGKQPFSPIDNLILFTPHHFTCALIVLCTLIFLSYINGCKVSILKFLASEIWFPAFLLHANMLQHVWCSASSLWHTVVVTPACAQPT